MTRRQSTATAKTSTGVTFRLNEPGMGEYERAGLAGLYLSLTAARVWQRQRSAWPLPGPVADRLDDLHEHLTNHEVPGFPLAGDGYGVRLEWRAGTEVAALKAIVNWAWQVHDGVLFLPGVHRKRQHLDCYYLRLHLHAGLLGTYFQFPTTIKKMKNEIKVERYDEEKTFTVSYRPISPEARLPQSKAVLPRGICDDIWIKRLPNWVYPGSETRFNTKGIERETGWRGLSRRAFLMLFAPIACHFIKLPESIVKGSSKDNWAYIVPHVNNIRCFHREFLRRNMANLSNWPFYGEVAGLEDAGLRYAVRHTHGGQSLTVVMGNAAYYHDQQKTRKNLWRDLAVTNDMSTAYYRYDVFNRAFPASNMVRSAGPRTNEDSVTRGNHRVVLPNSRERITANLLHGHPWYSDLAYIPFWQRDRVEQERKRSMDSISISNLWFRKLQRYEGPQLTSLIGEDRMWDDPFEKDMLDVFTQAFRRLLNREAKALERGGSRALPKRWDTTMDRWHRRLLNAKTRLLLSSVVHELLALAARSPAFRGDSLVEPGGPAILRNDAFHAEMRRMLSHSMEWKKIRDLALLAMATFADHRLRPSIDEAVTDQEESN